MHVEFPAEDWPRRAGGRGPSCGGNMRVPEELLYDVPSMPSQAPKSGVAWPGWTERVGRTLGDGPSIGMGIGMAALATWLVAGSVPDSKLAGVAVAQPHSATRAYVATGGAVQPTVTAELGLALQPGGATPASPGDHPLTRPTGTVKSVSAAAPDALTASPPSRATALSRSSAATTPAPPPAAPALAAPTTPAPTTLLPATPQAAPAAPTRTSTTPAGANHAAPAAPAPRATQRRAQQSSGQTNPGLLGGLLQILGL
jgi:hypothetical protein